MLLSALDSPPSSIESAARLLVELERLMQPWPDRANRKPETMTLEELTMKVHVHTGIDEIHSLILGEHTRLIAWLLRMVARESVPPANGRI